MFGRSSHKLLLQISAVIETDGERFHGFCPALKGLHVDGSTEKETLQNLVEAIGVYLTSIEREGDPLPIGPDLTASAIESLPRMGVHNVRLEWPSLQMCGIS